MMNINRITSANDFSIDDMVYRNPNKCLYEITGGFRSRIRDGLDFWQQMLGLGN